MDRKRWVHLMKVGGKLTPEEMAQGWHFCWYWDDLLVGPGTRELLSCGCGCAVAARQAQRLIEAKRPPVSIDGIDF